jgi:glutamate-ammonia-ligase adenylyltransferase
VAHTLAEAEDYYRDRASTWERLALLKARPVAGDRALGRRFLKELRPFVFGRPFGPDALREVLDVKHRLDQKVAERAETDRHVKLGFGGIREIEFVVQALQLRHAQRRPELRERGTLPALRALYEAGLLPEQELRDLEPAYVFLRDVENKLQMVADTQTHTLPREPEALRACALRLGYADGPDPAEELLLRDYRRHTTAANRVFRRVFEAGVPST